MEIQNELLIGIGTEETTTLKPAMVKIIDVKIEEVGDKGSKKVICICKHPNKEETINISAAKIETKGKLEVCGLWVNKDSQGLLRKGSALVLFMQKLGVENINGFVGKDVETLLDERGYLCFKGY